MSKPDDFGGFRNKKKGNSILWIFFGVIGFITIYFPLFGSNLRFTVGTFFSQAFTTLGTICLTLGLIIMVWGFLMLLCARSMKAISVMLVGFFLMLLGSFFLEPANLGVISNGESVPKGYH